MRISSHRALRTLRAVMSIPTAPFHEHDVAAFVKQFAAELGLPIQEDRAGNVIVRYQHPAADERSAIGLCAHMDHPGFEVQDRRHRELDVEWLGGLHGRFVQRDQPVEIFAQRRRIRAFVKRVYTSGGHAVERLLLHCNSDIPQPGDFGSFLLSDHEQRQELIHGRAIDDLAGVAAMLSALDVLHSQQLPATVWAIFTRAEELGFVGALALADQALLPAELPLISVEASDATAVARIGDGPVVRVGDRSLLFDRAVVYALSEIALRAQRGESRIAVQRALLPGGTCEASPFALCGHPSAGLSLPLGNYHNMGEREISDEFIDRRDYLDMVALLVRVATEWRDSYRGPVETLAPLWERWNASQPQNLARLRQRLSQALRPTTTAAKPEEQAPPVANASAAGGPHDGPGASEDDDQCVENRED